MKGTKERIRSLISISAMNITGEDKEPIAQYQNIQLKLHA